MKGVSIINILLVLVFITYGKVSLAQIGDNALGDNALGDNSLVKNTLSDPQQQVEFDKLIENLDYRDTKSTWGLKEGEKKEEEEEYDNSQPNISPNFSIDGNFTNAIAYILIVVLLLAVFFMIFSNVKLNKKIELDQEADDYIEDIEEVDTVDGFKQALLAGDYRSAIRMQFIKVLQLLQENNDINWKPEKTNRDYLRELGGTDQKNDFRKLSGIYELVWYGNTKIEKESFEQLNPSFEKFINGFDGK